MGLVYHLFGGDKTEIRHENKVTSSLTAVCKLPPSLIDYLTTSVVTSTRLYVSRLAIVMHKK